MRTQHLLFVIACLLVFAGCRDDDAVGGSKQKVTTYKVAVIMPATQQERWEFTANWALDNLKKAQSDLSHAVRLELEWFDEENTDQLVSYARRVASDTTYKAIIGPMDPENAYVVASACELHKKTLILPQCTSAEVQRIFASSPNVFNLTQSDIGQAEIMLSCAVSYGAKSVSMIVHYDQAKTGENETCYGATFRDWVGYLATETGLTVDTVATYSNNEEMREALTHVAMMYTDTVYDDNQPVLLFVPESTEEFCTFDKYYYNISNTATLSRNMPQVICSDRATSNEDSLTNHEMLVSNYEGIDIAAAATSAFIPIYAHKQSKNPISGEAQLFDAIYMITFALLLDPTDLNASLVSLFDGFRSAMVSWLTDDVSSYVSSLQNGISLNPGGVIGEWTFDEKFHSAVLSTTYRHWRYNDFQTNTIEYITLGDTKRSVSNTQIWDMSSEVTEDFDSYQMDMNYPELKDKYAVVVAASTGWKNYRHQADALDVYQLLRAHGYDDEHIILVWEGDILNDANNKFPNEVRVIPYGENLWKNVKVDYQPSKLQSGDLFNIFNGIVTERTPHVLHTTANDNVLIFWSGHGNDGVLHMDRNDIYSEDVERLLTAMHQGKKYRKLFFVMEACYSGSIAEKCVGIPGTLCLTAANNAETSKAAVMDPLMCIWLSNGFTRAFRAAIDENPDITLRDLYYFVAQLTVGSHPRMYNVSNYGNIFKNTFREFLR